MASFTSFLPKDVKFHRGRVTSIDHPAGKIILDDGKELQFDYLVVATGSNYGGPLKSVSKDLETLTTEIKDMAGRIKEANRILIIGGGSTGVELAGEIATDLPEKKVTLAHAGPALIPGPFKAQTGVRALRKLQALGVNVELDVKVKGLKPEEVAQGYTHTTRTVQATSIYAWAKGAPNSHLLTSLGAETMDEKGYVKVEPTLQLSRYPNIFAVGDVCNADIDLASAARGQGALAATNLLALLHSTSPPKLTTYRKMPNIIMVTIGRNDGVFALPFMVLGGWITRMLKGKDFMVGLFRKEVDLSS
ncbi:hypothetical protein BJ684DRAFT_10314 [Piptocephalis cylindrospora]|uniref:FAD/NAD(P)-binding domain-containing protein n=1 Tax=Piptocephalis cylindrospora TaxID=1907219 RepID=A0A4P9Y315_9FUNG|nr:hypothetical protein BJ684DRAFT_10314 [Piptocephalis cylindrospora]|eukprot:RKP13267.1 hypothetical protein BJ684DRAFT_10314 [Piptocephalis cylindrospora]